MGFNQYVDRTCLLLAYIRTMIGKSGESQPKELIPGRTVAEVSPSPATHSFRSVAHHSLSLSPSVCMLSKDEADYVTVKEKQEMGGDIYPTKSTNWRGFSKVCRRCQEERVGKKLVTYSIRICAQADCPDYAPWKDKAYCDAAKVADA